MCVSESVSLCAHGHQHEHVSSCETYMVAFIYMCHVCTALSPLSCLENSKCDLISTSVPVRNKVWKCVDTVLVPLGMTGSDIY